jgi:hypothetical protein
MHGEQGNELRVVDEREDLRVRGRCEVHGVQLLLLLLLWSLRRLLLAADVVVAAAALAAAAHLCARVESGGPRLRDEDAAGVKPKPKPCTLNPEP